MVRRAARVDHRQVFAQRLRPFFHEHAEQRPALGVSLEHGLRARRLVDPVVLGDQFRQRRNGLALGAFPVNQRARDGFCSPIPCQAPLAVDSQ